MKSLLTVKCIIPTIKSFHENTKFLRLRAEGIKTLLIGKLPPRRHCGQNGSVQSDVTLRHKKIRSSLSAYTMKKIIVLSTSNYGSVPLDSFLDLTGMPPRKEKGQDTPRASVDI